MAVRNLDAIKRHGTMIAEQIRNEEQMREDFFWKRVNIIKSCHDDAIDFIDTVKALWGNGLGDKYEQWMEQQNVHYMPYNKEIRICCLMDGKQQAHVYYEPIENVVCFGWSGWGMSEYYSTDKDVKNFIHNSLKGRHYDDGLTMMAERLQPFLKSFFEWVDSI